MLDPQTQILTDQWVKATWEEYLEMVYNPIFEQARGYYHNGQMRIEMAPIGFDHSSDNTTVTLVASLFGIAKGIPLLGLTNCSFRKVGVRACQPDLSYYIGERAGIIPKGTEVVNLNQYPPPDLVIEIAKTSLADDLEEKRGLYEALEISEYWVVDVQNAKVIAFAIAGGNSRSTNQSQVLPSLAFTLVEEALRQSHPGDQSQVVTWLLTQLQILT